jgi:tryptophan-rich sensory protein
MRTESQLARLAAETPLTRDRYVDLLRAFSIFVVVFGHWLMAVVYFKDGHLTGESALALVPGLWLATWVLQVMPLFFFVGGFSNSVSWQSILKRGGGYTDFIRSRITRLMRPTLVFGFVWTILAIAMNLAFPESFGAMAKATEVLAKPLWFLAVYVLVVALAPVMLALHKRYGSRVLVALGAAAVVVDFLRIGVGLSAIGYMNFVFVWLFAHQLGYFYADGSLLSFTRRFLLLAGLSAVALLAVLTASGVYSPSMVGGASHGASNNSPPSICLLVLTVWLASAAMFLRPQVSRWLEDGRSWTAVVAANSMIMTVFLWHLTALLVAVVVAIPLGFPQPDGGSALWWAWRPAWLAILVVVLAIFVAVFARFERPQMKLDPRPAAERGLLSVCAGVAALVAGLAGFATFGFTVGLSSESSLFAHPLVNLALLFGGYLALSQKWPQKGELT